MLLVRWDTLLVLDFGFDILSGATGLDLEGNGFACQGFPKDPHYCVLVEEKEQNYAS